MKKIGELFVENDILSQQELEMALNLQKTLETPKPLGEILVELEIITYDKLILYIEKQLLALKKT